MMRVGPLVFAAFQIACEPMIVFTGSETRMLGAELKAYFPR